MLNMPVPSEEDSYIVENHETLTGDELCGFYMHNKGIVHVDPKCSLCIAFHLIHCHPFKLFY